MPNQFVSKFAAFLGQQRRSEAACSVVDLGRFDTQDQMAVFDDSAPFGCSSFLNFE